MKRRPRSPGPAANCRTQGTGLARVQLMLERRHLVMAFAHRGKARLDELANRGIEIPVGERALRSEEHTSELQSLMRISYAVFCLKNKKNTSTQKIENAAI